MRSTASVRRPAVRFLAFAFALCAFGGLARRADAQQWLDHFRGEEVGPREMDLDEEAFLNLLSFEQPIETQQDFFAADQGWQITLGSLRADTLYLDHDLKLHAPVTNVFSVRVHARQGVDFDTDYTEFMLTPEFALPGGWSIGAPVVLSVDKGDIDGGLALTWRDAQRQVDFLQLSWMRSDLVIEERSDALPQTTVKRPADNFVAQVQADLFDFGRTTLYAAQEVSSDTIYEDRGEREHFSRVHARALQEVEFSESQRAYFDAEWEIANEQSTPVDPIGLVEAFEGDRDYWKVRGEWQRDLAPKEDPKKRLRAGAAFVSYREDAESPAAGNKVATDDTEVRHEAIGYAGWRTPLADSKRVDLETVLWLDRVVGQHRARITAKENQNYPHFQGKLSFYFRWQATERADFVISPSFELDEFGWGGGSMMLRCRI
jgi:hypothetical protein